ncbi:MAG: transporter substrate-binding domain-containing protein [Fimbriimonadales bacterium]
MARIPAIVALGLLLAGCERMAERPSPPGMAPKRAPSAPVRPSPRKLVFAGNAWWPWTGQSESGLEGFTVDLVRAALRRMGYEMEYRVRPWARVVRELEAGQIDGTTCACSGPERPWRFTSVLVGLGPDWVSDVVVLRSKSSRWRWRGPDSLKEARMALVSDYHYPSPLKERLAQPDDRLVVVSGEDPAVRMLQLAAKGSVDAVADDRLVFENALHRHPELRSKVEEVGTLPACRLHAAFSPKRADGERLARELSRAMLEVYRSPEFPRILARYGLEEAWRSLDRRKPARSR